MIEYIRGKIARLTPTTVVVESGSGIGYLVNISLNTYSKLEHKTECELLTHLQVREDAWTLYGFAGDGERQLFRALIGVSGVGAATAMLILSAFGPAQLQTLIAQGDSKMLKSVKGIGGKTAERIIVDLRDKIKAPDDALLIQTTSQSEVFDEALAALTMLGYTKAAAQKALHAIFQKEPDLHVEVAIKKALAMMM